jgi:hypothetical protein
MNLTGTIEITPDWAQLDLDPKQAIAGSVVLMKDPMSPNPTDDERIDAAREYFKPEQGVHYTLTGQPQPAGSVRYFLVTDAVQG